MNSRILHPTRSLSVLRGTSVCCVVTLLVAPGCQFLLGEDPVQCARDEDCPPDAGPLACVDGLCVETEVGTTTSVGNDASTSSSTSTEIPCDGSGECLPTAPAGWSGPVLALFSPGEPAACPADAPMPVRTGYAELEARDATCGCACPETKQAAEDCTGLIYGGQRCAESIPWNLNEDQCRAIPIYLLPPMAEAVFPARFDACTPAPTREVPPLVLSDRVQLCEAPTSDCDDGVCTPTSDAPNGILHCIWREGDPVCPDPEYPLRYVFYEDVRDERDCSPCTCGEQAACRFRIYTDTTCKGEHAWETFTGEEGVCESILDIVQSQFLMSVGALVTKVAPGPGFCEPSTSVPAGAAVEIEPFTVCCRQ